MGNRLLVALAVGIGIVFPSQAFAQDLVVYPSEGQSEEQVEQDKFQCYTWARDNTGFDPMERPSASSPPPPEEAPVGGVARGALIGGAGGLAVGAIAGDAGTGAAVGAVSGGLIGGLRRNEQNKQQEQAQGQWEQQQIAEYEQARSEYNRNYAACLEGRGYSVR